MKYFALLITLLASLYSSSCYTVVGVSRSDDHIQNESMKPEPDFAAYEPYSITPSAMWVYYYDTPYPWWYMPYADEYNAIDDTSATTDSSEPSPYASSRRNYGRRRAALNNESSGSSFSTGYGSPVYNSGGSSSSFAPSYSTGGSVSYSPTTPVKTDSTVQSGSSGTEPNTSTKTTETNKKRDFGNRRTAKKGDKK